MANTFYVDNFFSPDAVPRPATETGALTLPLPLFLVYSTPALVAASVSVQAPTINIIPTPATVTGTLTLEEPFLVNPINLTDVDFISFNLYASRTGSNLRFELHDTGGTITTITPNVLIANQWNSVNWDISAVANVDKDDIDTFTIVVVNDDAPNTFYVDKFIINNLEATILPNVLPIALAVEAPQIFGDNIFGVSTVASLVSVEAPIPAIFFEPSTITASISVEAPVIVVTNIPSTQELTGTVEAPIPNVIQEAATLALSLNVLAPFLIATQQMDIEVEAPVPVVTLDSVVEQAISIAAESPIPNVIPEAEEVEGTLSIETPVFNVAPEPAVVPIAITAETPVIIVITVAPATLAGALSVVAPTVNIINLPATQTLAVSMIQPVPEVSDLPAPATLAIGIEIPIPTIIVTAATLGISVSVLTPTPVVSQIIPRMNMGIFGPNMLNPAVGYLSIVFPRFLRDPIRTGGCPQCGTFLYGEYGAKTIKSEPILYGRNFDIEGEDRYIRCARCNWPVKPKRTPAHRKGAYTGWGLKYDEDEIIPNEPADDWSRVPRPSQPGQIQNPGQANNT